MTEIHRRNVHVFNSLNGAEVASKFSRRPLLPAYMLRLFPSMSRFDIHVRRLNQQVCNIPLEWALYPCQFDGNRAVGGVGPDSGNGNDRTLSASW